MFQRFTLLIVGATLLLGGGSARAQSEDENERPHTRQTTLQKQREEKSTNLEPTPPLPWQERIRRWEKAKFPANIFVKGWRGIRPLIGGMQSGSGTVFGAGYIYGLDDEYFRAEANLRRSTRGFTTADAEIAWPTPQEHRRIELRGRAEYRNQVSLRFYGLGNDSDVGNKSFFLQEDTRADAWFWLNPRGLLSVGAQAGYLRSRTGSSDEEPSLDAIRPRLDLIGFGQSIRHGVAGGWAEFDIRSKWDDPAVGIEARITALRYEDVDSNTFDFTRLVLDLKGYIPLGVKSRHIALRFRTSQSEPESGSIIPFFLMETVGGATTIRGFDEFRFRDTRNLLMNVEYRWEVLPFAYWTIFLDAGKVFHDRRDFNFDDLHYGYGTGLRIHVPPDFVLRLDFAWSVEDFKIHFNTGPRF
jgi:hemolysin activation/secretion protein